MRSVLRRTRVGIRLTFLADEEWLWFRIWYSCPTTTDMKATARSFQWNQARLTIEPLPGADSRIRLQTYLHVYFYILAWHFAKSSDCLCFLFVCSDRKTMRFLCKFGFFNVNNLKEPDAVELPTTYGDIYITGERDVSFHCWNCSRGQIGQNDLNWAVMNVCKSRVGKPVESKEVWSQMVMYEQKEGQKLGNWLVGCLEQNVHLTFLCNFKDTQSRIPRSQQLHCCSGMDEHVVLFVAGLSATERLCAQGIPNFRNFIRALPYPEVGKVYSIRFLSCFSHNILPVLHISFLKWF